LKIGFYLENDNLETVRFDLIEQGNPGCGGTQYTFMLAAFDLMKAFQDVVVYVKSDGIFPEDLKVVKVNDFEQALEISVMEKRYLVFRPHIFENRFIPLANPLLKESRLVAWLHVTPSNEQLRELSSHYFIKAFVCLGNNQLSRVYDSGIERRGLVIPSPLVFQKPDFQRERVSKQVVYLGALVPQKGFHLLADVWPRILKRHPGATLKVIGSGKLYNQSINLGPRGIASATYENRIFKKLPDGDPTVEFMGILPPQEKDELIATSHLGIVNPSGSTETYCGSGIEIQSLGVPLVTARKHGLRDTIKNGQTGFLIPHRFLLYLAISSILNDENRASKMGRAAKSWARTNFTREIATNRWIALINQLEKNETLLNYSRLDSTQWIISRVNSKIQTLIPMYRISHLEIYFVLRSLFRPLRILRNKLRKGKF
jgi:glycosyltransferase involved in cell wall biosynthesis